MVGAVGIGPLKPLVVGVPAADGVVVVVVVVPGTNDLVVVGLGAAAVVVVVVDDTPLGTVGAEPSVGWGALAAMGA